MAKILKPHFHKDELEDWVIICPECEGDAFEIRSESNPETDEDWEVSYVICIKCGAIVYDIEDYI